MTTPDVQAADFEEERVVEEGAPEARVSAQPPATKEAASSGPQAVNVTPEKAQVPASAADSRARVPQETKKPSGRIAMVPVEKTSDEALPLAGVSATSEQPRDDSALGQNRIGLIPLVGTMGYNGFWGLHVQNYYSWGLGVDIPLSRLLSLELDASHSRNFVAYSFYGHPFDLYSFGANLKMYFLRNGFFRPYASGGLSTLLYANMSRGPLMPVPYTSSVGAGQVAVGSDFALSESIFLGLRAQYTQPFINVASVPTTPFGQPLPGFEEVSLMSTSFWQFMGSVRVAL